MTPPDRIKLAVYAVWAALVLAITFLSKGLNADNVTRLLITLSFFAQLAAYPALRTIKNTHGPKTTFIALGMTLAAVGEGFYMFSRPVFESLTITAETGLGQAVKYYLTDLIFTLPAYAAIFWVIWRLINRYQYSPWEYFILVSLGQSLGDGGFFFLAAPHMLAFLPYVMLNYQAMNLLPYLLVRDKIATGKGGRMKYIVTPSAIIATYLAMGALIITAGKITGLR
jgi:hypothetical protein